MQDGVLSYYKIHGPDKIEIDVEYNKNSTVIGEESLRRLSHKHRNGLGLAKPKAFGEIHLKVSTIRGSRSDDKKFSIYTGIKMLHLRAETREDRDMWMEALRAVKEMFPRISNSELMAPVDDFMVSTEKLRQRLVEEGVSEVAIQDSEQIVRTEFASLQVQLALLKQKHALLIDTLRHMETEKVDLENTVVDESQRRAREDCSASRSRAEKCSGSTSEMEDENDRQDAGDDDSDEEDNTYFDTRDFLSSGSLKSSTSEVYRSDIDTDCDEQLSINSSDGYDASITHVKSVYPYIKRRKKLPEPVEKEKGVSLWSIIKDNIGKDLTKVCLPVYFNEPLSSLQKCFEDLEYSYLLDQAYECGRKVHL